MCISLHVHDPDISVSLDLILIMHTYIIIVSIVSRCFSLLWYMTVIVRVYVHLCNCSKQLRKVYRGDISSLVRSEPLPSPAYRLVSVINNLGVCQLELV